ncbi:MAG: DUF2283 domain-containing protein [Planctomycetes bacterium]|nr:DUF2283 domain-containing protein [Planctomycetota bacterium]
MAAPLIVEYDAVGDILYLGKTKSYAEQESEEIDCGVVARLNPTSGEVENLEILFFTARAKAGERVSIPVLADFRLPQPA